MSGKNPLKMLIPKKLKRIAYEKIAAHSLKWEYGLKQIVLGNDEAAVTCLVKNGEYYIRSFIEHYLEMGFRHVFLLDNGSTDETLTIAKSYPNVSLYSTDLYVGKYQVMLKKCIAQKAVVGGWCLDVDIDEYFDYPYSDLITLGQLLQYLNRNKYSVVVTQMLDMFSDETLAHLSKNEEDEDIKETYRWYDIACVAKEDYSQSDISLKYARENVVSNQGIQLYYGGIRESLYGIHCLLSKHSLFSRQQDLELFSHVHFMNKAKVADISAVLYHYKLTSNALETSAQNKTAFIGTSQGYADLITLLHDNPNYRIKQESARKLNATNDLLEEDYLVISNEYTRYVNDVMNQTAKLS